MTTSRISWGYNFGVTSVLIIGSITLLASVLSTVIYRRYLHPIAHVPGPVLASVSELNRFYYNVIKEGRYYLQYDRYREIYGDVIRVAPNEVLIADAENFDQIHRVGSRFYRDPGFYLMLGSNKMVFSAISNEEHRSWRAVLNPFFSRRAVLLYEDIIRDKTDEFCRLIEENIAHGLPMNIMFAARALATDSFTAYAFGLDNCWNCLKEKDLGRWWPDLIYSLFPMIFFFRLVPWLKAPLDALPYWAVKVIAPEAMAVVGCQEVCKTVARNVKQEVDNGIRPEHDSIYHTILSPKDIPSYKQPTVDYIGEEAFNLVAAGTETTGGTIEYIIYYVLSNSAIYDRLCAELTAAFPELAMPMPYVELEKLPYLTAVIKEGLRLTMGVIMPLPRVVPVGGAIFSGVFLLEGTVVSTCPWFNHRDPRACPNPDTFNPDRWLDREEARRLDKFMIQFSRGQRICIGQSFAYVELYICLGRLFRKFGDLDLDDTTAEDMAWVDSFTPHHPRGARGLRIMRTMKL